MRTDATTSPRDRTPAQWYCLLGGGALLLAGILGFFADSAFDTGSEIEGGELIVFEVNGIHNLIHLASGALLLAVAGTNRTARMGALIFGLVYGLVTIIGIVDGETVLGLIPVNGADNVLHIALSAVGILAALSSPKDGHRGTGTGAGDDRFARGEAGATTHDRVG